MGRAGMKGGAIHAQNIQAGEAIITTNGSGVGNVAVTFKKAMKAVPKIVVTIAEADTTGTIHIQNKTNIGFDVHVNGSSVVSSSLDLDWIAFDDSYN